MTPFRPPEMQPASEGGHQGTIGLINSHEADLGIAAKIEPGFPRQVIRPRPGIRAAGMAGNESASHTFRSGKNEVMRILILRKRRAKLPRALKEWPGQILAALVRVGVGLLDRVHDQRTDGGAGLLCAVSQPVVEWLRNVNSSTNRHDIIMS
jgi:hypothetical protein